MRRPGRTDLNFWLGVYNGILINGADAFFHSSLVLAPFLAALGAPPAVVGLIPALRVGGWFLPQLLVASRLAHVPFKLPWYRRMSLVRVLAFSGLTAAALLVDSHSLLATLALAMIAVNAVAGGISGVPFADVTAKVVPHYRLGTFWALRNAIGGLLALLSGAVLQRVLDSQIPFPRNFGYLFLAGTALTALAYLAFSAVREPSGKPGHKQPLLHMLRRVPRVIREDVPFRRFIRVRFLGLLALLAEPFYAVYALDALAAPAAALGWFVVLATFASIVANFLFRLPADRGANVTVMQISLGLLVAAPLVALAAEGWTVFALVFVLSAAGNSGVGIAAWNLLYAVAPEDDRPLYVGVANTYLSLPSLAPALAGTLAAVVGFQGLFLGAAVLAVVALAFAFRFERLRALDLAAARPGASRAG